MRKRMIVPIDSVDDLDELGASEAWTVVKALASYYRSGVFPHHLTGEAKLCFISIIEREAKA